MTEDWGTAARYKIQGVLWKKLPMGADKIIYAATMGDQTLRIRLNDFPDEPLYTLIVDQKEVVDFNDWPKAWNKP